MEVVPSIIILAITALVVFHRELTAWGALNVVSRSWFVLKAVRRAFLSCEPGPLSFSALTMSA